ncbi:hypothetical protein P692DRAFT_20820995 [Suillus brevipes Sb2]|nr:hypothetical protein P692DRAFT_20820995 [Suillus brevipes Sb2]
MSNIIHFILFRLCQEFLGESEEEKMERLKIAWALAGVAMLCTLDEQYEDIVKIDHFGELVHNRKFLAILNALSALSYILKISHIFMKNSSNTAGVTQKTSHIIQVIKWQNTRSKDSSNKMITISLLNITEMSEEDGQGSMQIDGLAI